MAKLEFGMTLRRRKRLMSKNQQLAIAETSSSSSSSSFMSDLNDDLLIEILLCLPHSLSAVKCSLVCKRWSSIIFSYKFRTRFNQRQHHNHSPYLEPSYSLPFTLLFRFLNRKIDDITFTSHALSANAPPAGIHHYPKSSGYLDFLPGNWPRSRIETSSGDLLLSSFRGHRMNYCVSNPLTRRWNILPGDMPRLNSGGTSGLWLDPNQYGSNKHLGNYKVVVLDGSDTFVVAGANYTFRASMFCSETKKWSQRNFTVPRASTDLTGIQATLNVQAVVNKGVLYFPLTADWSILAGFLTLDPCGGSECGVVNLPEDSFGEWRTALLYRVGAGVVRGMLRLWQLLNNNGSFDLKVWELGDDDDGETVWVLVHDVRVKRGNRINAISVVALDPNHGDVVFMMLNNTICKYNIRQDKDEKIGELPYVQRTRVEKEYVLWNFLSVHSVLHTSYHLLPT